jgi:hypothetical protein
MRSRRCVAIIMLSLMLVPIVSGAELEVNGLAVGTGMWLRFHHGPSTFALTPGASLDASFEIIPDLRLGGKFVSGAFFGYATGVEISVLYSPVLGSWMPGIGVAAQGVFGSTVFYYHGGTDYVEALFPEWSAGVALRPLQFSFGSFGISTLEIVIGTDLRQFAKILLIDVDLFRVSMLF